MDIKETLVRLASAAQEEFEIVSATLKEKGGDRFGRPLVLGLAMTLGAYALVYRPSRSHLDALERKIAAAKSIAKYADQYSDLRDSLNATFYQLPRLKDRDTWLLDLTRTTLSDDGLITDSLAPPVENKAAGLVYQHISVTLSRITFEQLARWIQRIENVKPAARVTRLQVSRGAQPGQERVTCEVSTVIPVQRMGQ